MLHPAKVVGALCLVMALAGCETTQTARFPSDHPPDVDLNPQTPAPPARESKQPAAPAVAPVQLPPAVHAPPLSYTAPLETWVQLSRWAQANQLGPVTKHYSSVASTFTLRAASGNLTLHIGSTLAQWSGLELRLGFEPQLIGGEVYVHRLDLQKNLIPLLSGAPAPFTGSRVIVLDPGHGGHEPGSLSGVGGREKDYTLDWARRLKVLLEADGWRVLLTRTNDADTSLAARVEFAETHGADLFLSLHFNATKSTQQAGIETYCVTPTGMPSSVTRDYEDNVNLVFPNNRFDTQNLSLAMRLHRELLAATGAQDRGVRRARFLTVLRGQNRPAALIEGGYMSNPGEAALVNSAEYRQKLAEAVARALRPQLSSMPVAR